jgi:hypothetical protein
MDSWFIKRDIKEVKDNALMWKNCKTEDQRQKHVSKTLMRWSEIYRLTYFDPIRFLVVDPMSLSFPGNCQMDHNKTIDRRKKVDIRESLVNARKSQQNPITSRHWEDSK